MSIVIPHEQLKMYPATGMVSWAISSFINAERKMPSERPSKA
jgi:hypothetical protein